VIVLDTTALSHVFRRAPSGRAPHPVVPFFRRLVEEDAELAIPGVVFQELLPGVRSEQGFRRPGDPLGGFPSLPAPAPTHRAARRVRNTCRARGIAAASFDCLIAAHALENDADLLTLDGDFGLIAGVTKLRVVTVGAAAP